MLHEEPVTELVASVKAQIKAEAIIQSCTTRDHLTHAMGYIHLYFERFKDPASFEHLVIMYQNRKKKINVFD